MMCHAAVSNAAAEVAPTFIEHRVLNADRVAKFAREPHRRTREQYPRYHIVNPTEDISASQRTSSLPHVYGRMDSRMNDRSGYINQIVGLQTGEVAAP